MRKPVDDLVRARLRARFAEVLSAREVASDAELWDSEVLRRLTDDDLETLTQVLAAQQRLEQGRYGECISCHRPISRGRLDAQPEAACCFDCADDRRHGARTGALS